MNNWRGIDRSYAEDGQADELKKQLFAERLVRWFRANQRDLPWRRTKDPYHIWVSEIMLQQTRVDTVIPYYERFLSRYPTVYDLAEADEADLLKVWEGLGYYSRVRNMQIAAQTIVQEYGGRMPDTREEISKLRGIGPYTAGAVLSIAYGKPEPAVDGNVLRVISRSFLLYDDIAKPAARTKVEKLLAGFIPADAATDFNQGLMELGALICTPRSPGCGGCPVAGVCAAYQAGVVEELPVKTKAKKPRYEERAAYIIEGSGERQGMIMLRKRPEEGLLARMWELPNEQLSFEAQKQFGLTDYYYMDAEHIFSHIRWQIKVYVCDEDEAETVLGEHLAMSGASVAAETAATYEGDGANADSSAKTANYGGNGLISDSSDETAATDKTNGSSLPESADDVIWVSRETWRDVALPNVFLRILERYFSDQQG